MNNKGFSLVEVLAVVVIVGVLTAIAVPQYQNAMKKARATEAQTMLRSLYDSSERLATEFGYDDYAQMSSVLGGSGSKISIARLDMFGNPEGDASGSRLPAGASLQNSAKGPTSEKLILGEFEYKLMASGNEDYLAAKARAGDFSGSLILLNRHTMDLFCYTASEDSDNACDVWGLERVANKVTF